MFTVVEGQNSMAIIIGKDGNSGFEQKMNAIIKIHLG